MTMKKYEATVNDSHSLDIQQSDLENLDITGSLEKGFHLIRDDKSYAIKVVSADKLKKEVVLSVNGTTHTVSLADKYDLLVKKMGLNVASSAKMNEVKAPMPGLVLGLKVKAGDSFEKGDALLVLEAMKMENVIKATGEGTVKSIAVVEGDAVEKGQLLIELA